MKLKTISITVFSLALVGLIGYRILSNTAASEKNAPNGDKKPPMMVKAVVITENDYANTLTLSGSIEANESVAIQSEVAGVVEKIYFSEGATVSMGQVLFKVNDLELRAQLSQAKTRQNLAAENERRAGLLLQKEAISQEEFDIASAEFRSLKAQTQFIEAQIAKTTVRAPFSGKIGLRSISPGTYVTPSVLITNLVNTNPVKITFSIPEKYASMVQLNTRITFKVAGTTDEFEAKVYAMEPSIDIATRTLQVRATAENKGNKLFPGTYATVELPLDVVKNAILIPTEAIVPSKWKKSICCEE